MTGQGIHAEAELEGDGSTWWYVCGECHGAINYKADICPHCKAVLSWDGLGLPGLSNQNLFRMGSVNPAAIPGGGNG